VATRSVELIHEAGKNNCGRELVEISPVIIS